MDLRSLYRRLRSLAGRVVRRVRASREIVASTGRSYRRLRNNAQAVRRLVSKEREWETSWSARQPQWWRHGFLSRSAILYDLEHNDPSLFVSDLQRYASTKRMVHPRIQDVINNKLTTHLLLDRIGLRTSELMGVYWRGGVHAFPEPDRYPLKDFLKGLDEGRPVFFKPFTGAEGKKIYSVTRLADGFRVNGEVVGLQTVRSLIEGLKRPMVVERGLAQHPATEALYPHSVNTLRILTILEMPSRKPFIALAVQRMGADSCAPVDNWSRGGLSAQIDLETGRLGRAARLPTDRGLEWFDHHPDTGAPITGAEVPGWQELRDTVLRAAQVLSFMEYIGWDIVITPDGPAVLEANINSGMNVLQVHKPLLSDPRARAYFEKRGVVGPLIAVDPAVVDDDVVEAEDEDDPSDVEAV